MSEKVPATNNNESGKSAFNPDSGLSYKEYLEQGGEMGQKLRERTAAENVQNTEENSVDTTAELEVRPVEDGEYQDSLRYEYNTNPEHEDYLPIGVMAHEPWTIAPKEGEKTPQEPPVEGNDPVDSPETPEEPVAAPRGRYSLKGSDLYNNGRETVDGREPENRDNVNQYGYAGPVEPGSEIELAGPTDIEPYNPGPTAIEPIEKGGDLVQQPEVDPALIEALNGARTRYAEETAKSRKSYLGRFLRTDSKVANVLRKIPGVEQGAEWLNGKFDQAVVEAKDQYEALYNQVGDVTAAELRRVGWDEEMIQKLSLIGNIAQDSRLEAEILYQRQAHSKDSNKFVNWWVAQKGFTGKLKKAGVVIAAGAATGLTGGLFAGATGAFIAGGASGAAIANHVTKRRANSIDESGMRLAVRQSNADHALKRAAIKGRHGAEDWGQVEDITGRTERRTNEEMLGNRKRLKTATALGAAAGRGAFQLKELLNQPEANPKTPQNTPPKNPQKPPQTPEVPDEGPTAPPAETPPATPEVPINGREFFVDPGHGFTHEIQEFAQANGSSVDARRAFDIYNEAVAKFGEDGLIEPVGTYLRDAGDFGINAPGNAQWKPGVAEFFKSKLQ